MIALKKVGAHEQAGATAVLSRLFSFNGSVVHPFALLISATSWMFVVYLIGETLYVRQDRGILRAMQVQFKPPAHGRPNQRHHRRIGQ